MSGGGDQGRLVGVEIDPDSIRPGPVEVEHERAAAIHDLLADNVFQPVGILPAQYNLRIAMAENKLVLAVRDGEARDLVTHVLSMTPFRKVIRDYFLIRESYYSAVRNSTPTQIEAIDMGRRGLHDEAASILMQRLDGKLLVDSDTARRLFTLICALHWKG